MIPFAAKGLELSGLSYLFTFWLVLRSVFSPVIWFESQHKGSSYQCNLGSSTEIKPYRLVFELHDGQKHARHSPKKTCFVERVSFSISNFHISTPSPFLCCNHATVSTEHISTLKRGREWFGYRQKRCSLKFRKDADRKRLFCSNVSTLLSMIVAM